MNVTDLVRVIATTVREQCTLPGGDLRADTVSERLMLIALQDCGVLRITNEHGNRLFAVWVDEPKLHCVACAGET